jgi:hypothetical protein
MPLLRALRNRNRPLGFMKRSARIVGDVLAPLGVEWEAQR